MQVAPSIDTNKVQLDIQDENGIKSKIALLDIPGTEGVGRMEALGNAIVDGLSGIIFVLDAHDLLKDSKTCNSLTRYVLLSIN